MSSKGNEIKKVIFSLKEPNIIRKCPIKEEDSKIKDIFIRSLKQEAIESYNYNTEEDFSFCINEENNQINFLTYLTPINSMFLLKKISDEISEQEFFVEYSCVIRHNHSNEEDIVVNCYEPSIKNPNLLRTYVITQDNVKIKSYHKKINSCIVEGIATLEQKVQEEYNLRPNITKFKNYKASIDFLADN